MGKGLLKKWNAGFTLVEVLVAVGIASIAILSVGGFMAVSARSFSSTSADVNLQQESQLAYNQLQDLIVDAQYGVTQANDYGGTETIVPAEAMLDDAADQKIIYIYGQDNVYKIIWNHARNELLYEEYDITINPSGEAVLGASRVLNALMAENIVDFDVDLSLLEEKGIVEIHMAFERNNKSYDANYNITIRNKVAVNAAMASYTSPVPVAPSSSISTLSSIVVEPGSVYNFPAPVVFSSAITDTPSQVVRWSMDTAAPADGGTTIDAGTGRLQVSSSESHDMFQVIVTTDDGLASATITVYVRKVTGVSLAYQPAVDREGNPIPANLLTTNNQFQLKATVSMNYEEELTAGASGHTLAEAKALEWEIREGSEYLEAPTEASIVNNIWPGKMKTNITTDKPLRVRATAKHSRAYAPTEGVYGEWTGRTYMKPNDFEIRTEGKVERGQEYAFNVAGDSSQGHIYLFTVDVRKKVVDADGVFLRYEKQNDEDYIVRLEQGNNVKIQFPTILEPYAEYEVDVSCYKFRNPSEPWNIRYGFLKDYAGRYRIENAVGQSSLDTIALSHSELYFDSGNSDPLTLVKYYTPRKFGKALNDEDTTSFTIGGITKFRMTDFNLNADSISWSFYENPTGGKRESDFKRYNMNTNMLRVEQGGNTLNLRYRRNNWNNNVPQVLYLIPTIRVGSNGNYKHFLMYHTYVKCINYNITINNERLYFPYPLCELDGLNGDQAFPGRNLTDRAPSNSMKGTWYNYNNQNNNRNYDYQLKRYLDSGSGIVKYTLSIGGKSYSIDTGQYAWK